MPTSGIVRELRAAVGHALLQLPSVSGGCIEPNESPEVAVSREMREETGLDVEPGRLVGVFGGPRFRVPYPNGDETSYVTAAFECVVRGGTLRPDGDEALDARFFAWDEIDDLEITPFTSALLNAVRLMPSDRWMTEFHDVP
jgi:ADP-ribose pyrophosphatase YjhB (NUDIX family)